MAYRRKVQFYPPGDRMMPQPGAQSPSKGSGSFASQEEARVKVCCVARWERHLVVADPMTSPAYSESLRLRVRGPGANARRPHRRAGPIAAVTLVVVALLGALSGMPVQAAGRAPTPPTVPLPPSKAAVVVDAGTGGVLQASNDRTPVAVASAFKIFTALVVHRLVRPTQLVRISKRAAGMPARKINVKAGQRWTADGLLHSMLLASANDAAVAMAEKAGGSTAGYERLFRAEARSLQLQDHPTLHDPAGLDDEFSVDGGNLISARDLAIVARAFLRQADLASIVELPEYRFAGGDGVQHRVVNHNRFLRTYPGAIGMKTGFTRRSGYTLVAAARRNGHTLIAIVVQSANTIQEASGLLDAGFAKLRRHGRVLGYLPGADRPTVPRHRSDSTARREVAPALRRDRRSAPVQASAGTPVNQGWTLAGVLEGVLLIVCVLVAVVAFRRREVVRRREAARRQRERERIRAAAGDAIARRPLGATASQRSQRSSRAL